MALMVQHYNKPIVLSEVTPQCSPSTPGQLRPSGSDTLPLSFDRPTFGGYEVEGYGFEEIALPVSEDN